MRKFIAIIGTPSSGKTSYVTKLNAREVSVSPLGVRSYVIAFDSNSGEQHFRVGIFPSLRTVSWRSIDGVIIIIEKTRQDFLQQVKEYITKVEKQVNIPIVICGSKYDQVDKEQQIEGKVYFDISSLDEYNLEKPFLFFSRHFNNNPDISFLRHKL